MSNVSNAYKHLINSLTHVQLERLVKEKRSKCDSLQQEISYASRSLRQRRKAPKAS